MKIASWNVNSLNVRLAHLGDWLAGAQPDIVALQETKLEDAKFPIDAIASAGYRCIYSGQKTYNGMALLARSDMTDVLTDIPGLADPQRRILIATIGGVRVVNLYVVNGQAVGSEKYAYKLDWLAKVRNFLAEELQRFPQMIVLGDFNIVPDDRDIYDPVAWHEQILCSTPERAALKAVLDLGLHDSYRLFESAAGHYSWWDYRQAGISPQPRYAHRSDSGQPKHCARAAARAQSIGRHAHGSGLPITHRYYWNYTMPDISLGPNWPAILDDTELEELDLFLRAHAGEDALLLDGVHGLLTVIGIGPVRATPDEWLPEILHEPFADEAEGKRILELLARLNESVELELESDSYEPILGEIELDDGDTALSAQGWCEGFSRGVDLNARLWETRLGADTQLTELLGPIMALAVEEGVFATDADFAPLSEQEYDECLAQLPSAISAVAHYWQDSPPTAEELAGSTNASTDSENPRRKRGGRWVH